MLRRNRKLALGSIGFLTQEYISGANVICINSAPGLHIPILSQLFPDLHFHCFDTRKFAIEPVKDKISVFEFEFDLDVATDYAVLPNILLISDFNIHGSDPNMIITGLMAKQQEIVRQLRPISVPNDDWFCEVDGEELAGEIEVETTKRYGCASHPLLQAALLEEGAKQEREVVFSFIRDFITTHVPEGGCPFGKMNSEECLDVRDGQCEICIIDHAIESLRGRHEKKD